MGFHLFWRKCIARMPTLLLPPCSSQLIFGLWETFDSAEPATPPLSLPIWDDQWQLLFKISGFKIFFFSSANERHFVTCILTNPQSSKSFLLVWEGFSWFSALSLNQVHRTSLTLLLRELNWICPDGHCYRPPLQVGLILLKYNPPMLIFSSSDILL